MDSKLKAMSILYFVMAGWTLLSVVMIPMQMKIMDQMMEMEIPVEEGQPDPKEMFGKMKDIMKYVFIGIGVFSAIFALIFFVTGMCIIRRKKRTLAVVGSAASCLVFPLGTALGIWSLVVLLSDEAVAEFDIVKEEEQFGNFG